MSSHILVDQQAGSKDLTRYIIPQSVVRRSPIKLPTDVIFTGRGPLGCTLEVGIEYKTVWDVLDCIQTGRFAGNQLEPLREFDFPILLIEGIVKRGGDDRGGRLLVFGTPRGRSHADWYDTSEWGHGNRIWTYVEFEHWYWSMMWRGGVTVLPFTSGKWDSGRLVGSLWRSFNDKAWEEHTAHHANSKAHIAPLRGDVPAFVRAISEYAGLGTAGALAAERTFRNMRRACKASPAIWAALMIGGGMGKGGKRKRAHRLGKSRGQQVWDELGGVEPKKL